LHAGYGVVFRPDGALPSPEALKATARAWVERCAADPIRGAILMLLDRGLLKLEVMKADALPAPPADFFAVCGAGEVELERLRRATHRAMIGASDVPSSPRFGLWGALSAARAIAADLGGVILDARSPRLLPIESYSEPPPADGEIRITDHVLLFTSVNERGLGWMTSSGLCKFGLPELEIRSFPPDLAEGLMPVMNGVAHQLASATSGTKGDATEPLKELQIGPEIRFGLDDLARAYGQESAEPAEGARGWTWLGLEHHRRSGFLRLVPPKGHRGDMGVWLHAMLGDLFGAENTLRNVETDSEAMDAAHRRAIAELPRIKARFQAGLRPGERLHVKHGFPTDNEGHHEYMWLGVNTWSGTRVCGQLMNKPQVRLDLRAGEKIELDESDLFDWYLVGPNGHEEGGYTDRVVHAEGQLPD
jgi:uncharacterized protein YegJ (DUF2314 family)